jgi:hypothetical protein
VVLAVARRREDFDERDHGPVRAIECDETAELDAVNVSVYRESQGLQSEISPAFRTVFAKHRKFVLAEGPAPVDIPSAR